eukprot:15478988-Alexandrium_andersonii.AAC.1
MLPSGHGQSVAQRASGGSEARCRGAPDEEYLGEGGRRNQEGVPPCRQSHGDEELRAPPHSALRAARGA